MGTRRAVGGAWGWSAIVVGVVVWSATPARADNCYAIKSGTKLYADVMADTEVGKVTADVIGWFGRPVEGEPTIELKLVRLDGDLVQDEVLVRVRRDLVMPAACPPAWKRGAGPTVDLTWPDARWAGLARPAAIAPRRKRATPRLGRACFASTVPGVEATVCVPVRDAAKPTCVAIAAGKPVFARATTAARVGSTTQRVIGTQLARVDDLLYVRVDSGHGATHDVYARRTDTRTARCPRRDDSIGWLSAVPPVEALLPDGSDAGFRVDWPMLPAKQTVTARGRTLRCFDYTPVPGLALHVCTPG